MSFTILFLATSCLACDDKGCCEPAKPAPACATCCNEGKSSCAILDRLFGKPKCERCDKDCAWHGTLFCRHRAKRGCNPCACKCAVACSACCESAPRITTVAMTLPAAPTPPSEIKPEYLGRLGQAADYTWVTGQLYFIHADGGLWVVRYAPVDREDRYGGSVVLAAATHMGDYREGDLITVHGEVLDEGRASKYLGGPLYRANSLEMVARSEK